MKKPLNKYLLSGIVIFLLFTSCATYYQRTIKFQNYIAQADFDKAQRWLSKDKKGKRPRNRVLHLFNQGWVDWITGKAEESNKVFAEADILIEDQQKNYALEALALITNPTVKPYKPEDFEVVLVNYFKALNYLKMDQYNEALVECRKINIKLNQLNDKYKDRKNRYSRDAFAHLLMGLIYDATGDYNNAFIAYRNSLEAYDSVYMKNFGLKAPEQLKHDLLRAAYRTGFYDEVASYEKLFNMKYVPAENEGGELVVFWHNGFGPVKSEWSINFYKTTSEGGFVTFANTELGLSFPLYIGNLSDNEKSGFSELDFLRIAFPKYTERFPLFDRAELSAFGKTYPLELTQNVNDIALKTLNDRMLREMGNALLRLASKKAMEIVARKNKKEDLGAALSIVNAITETADTRNWQTLPFSISYTRIPMPVGADSLNLKVSNAQQNRSVPLKFDIRKGETRFYVYNSLEIKEEN